MGSGAMAGSGVTWTGGPTNSGAWLQVEQQEEQPPHSQQQPDSQYAPRMRGNRMGRWQQWWRCQQQPDERSSTPSATRLHRRRVMGAAPRLRGMSAVRSGHRHPWEASLAAAGSRQPVGWFVKRAAATRPKTAAGSRTGSPPRVCAAAAAGQLRWNNPGPISCPSRGAPAAGTGKGKPANPGGGACRCCFANGVKLLRKPTVGLRHSSSSSPARLPRFGRVAFRRPGG
jgi:hypothetical protein